MQHIAQRAWPMVALFVLLLLSLYLLANFSGDIERFGRLYVPLLLLNAAGIVFITVLIGINTWNLVRQFRQRAAGARLTARLVSMFVLLALVPVTIVYSFSVHFISSGIDSWLDVEVERALDDALQLSAKSLDFYAEQMRRDTATFDERLPLDAERGELQKRLHELRVSTGASWLALYGESDRLTVATRRADRYGVADRRLPLEIADQVQSGEAYSGIDPEDGERMQVRVVIPLPERGDSAATGARWRLLEARYPVPGDIDELASSVERAVGDYRELVFLRQPLKASYILTLSLVLLLSVLTAVWAAFFSARRLMLPIHSLAEGTRAVAEGNYATRLPESGRDELGFVVRSFNQMTRRLRHARDQARRNRLQVESQRAYLEAVLERISTGVMTLSAGGRLYTANYAASRILGITLAPRIGRKLGEIAADHPPLGQFLSVVLPRIEQETGEWREEFELPGRAGSFQERKIIVCRGARLPDGPEAAGGWVIVFDDVSAMVQAQREAAWAEVARRLAHEIKNPLTPIQLSAERLRHKLLEQLESDEAQMLDRSTRTIIEQVEALKGMVRAFADYAATPAADFRAVDLNRLVAEVADMYDDSGRATRVELDLVAEPAVVHADRARLRQVLHNLIKNALEAQQGRTERVVILGTARVVDDQRPSLQLRVCDEGRGIPNDLLDRLFEPYTTAKHRGSGLGLAIVKKIIEEHGGYVRAENRPSGGACVVCELPPASAAVADTAAGGDVG